MTVSKEFGPHSAVSQSMSERTARQYEQTTGGQLRAFPGEDGQWYLRVERPDDLPFEAGPRPQMVPGVPGLS
jgi:hypothetical protein